MKFYRIKILTISIVSALLLTYAQFLIAAKTSLKIFWQLYLFGKLVFPSPYPGHLSPGDSLTFTLARLSPEYWFIVFYGCLIFGIILYSYFFSKLLTNIFPPSKVELEHQVSNSRTKKIAVGVCSIIFFILILLNLKLETPKLSPVTLEYGQITFDVPETMKPNDTAVIHLAFNLKTTIYDLKERFQAAAEKRGERIIVSDLMEAHLSCPNFVITTITPEIQDVSRNNLTEWQWEVFPTSEGQHELHLTLSALLSADSASPLKTIITFRQKIDVNKEWHQKISSFFEKNWQLLLASHWY